ncbi:hypothetical protein SAMN02745124_01040 [Desulfofustis glycolicus DSM 9705]|uniref:Uncharacterized protein n=1 Tax=Desulfofustis glycolicus DSM 9705 TaxID=1121409 RepID=A0A1M5U6U9_9BACT|nr:hypothetical protein SAMN02745124_01040 [Desulfofustis glycolicus DSM 9705]
MVTLVYRIDCLKGGASLSRSHDLRLGASQPVKPAGTEDFVVFSDVPLRQWRECISRHR